MPAGPMLELLGGLDRGEPAGLGPTRQGPARPSAAPRPPALPRHPSPQVQAPDQNNDCGMGSPTRDNPDPEKLEEKEPERAGRVVCVITSSRRTLT